MGCKFTFYQKINRADFKKSELYTKYLIVSISHGLCMEDLFEFGPDEPVNWFEEPTTTAHGADPDQCPACGGQMIAKECGEECIACGMQSDRLSADQGVGVASLYNHNTSGNSSVSLWFTGAHSYSNQRHLLSSISNYPKAQRNLVKKQFAKQLYQTHGIKIAPSIVDSSIDYFIKFVQPRITRADVRTGTFAAILYYEHKRADLGLTISEICTAMGIDRKIWSKGDSRLRELEAQGVLKLPDCDKSIDAYMNIYLARLGIPNHTVYREFASNLIDLTENKKLGKIAKSCLLRSRCVGCIYLLTLVRPELRKINKEQISKHCVISDATFTRFSNEILRILRTRTRRFKWRRRGIRRIMRNLQNAEVLAS